MNTAGRRLLRGVAATSTAARLSAQRLSPTAKWNPNTSLPLLETPKAFLQTASPPQHPSTTWLAEVMQGTGEYASAGDVLKLIDLAAARAVSDHAGHVVSCCICSFIEQLRQITTTEPLLLQFGVPTARSFAGQYNRTVSLGCGYVS